MDGPTGDIAPKDRTETTPQPARVPPGPGPLQQTRRRGWLGWGVWIVVLLALAWVGWRFVWPIISPAPTSNRAAQAEPAQPVGAATIGKADVQVVLNALGTVTPLATVTVKTQIAGQLVQIAFKEGQLVKKGDFLAQIDPRPYQAALEQAQANLARDQATLRGAQVDLGRYRTLVSQDSIAKQTLDTQAALVGTDQGTVMADQAAIDTARLNLTYCHIVAPATGRVGLRQVDEGNYVQTSDTNGIVVITQLQPISVIFSVPEDNIPQIQKQMRAGMPLETDAWDRSNVTKLASGTLLTIDNQVDTTTGTVKLRSSFPNDDESLFPSQFVNARLLVNVLHDVVVAPTAAIQRGEPGTFVYVIGDDGVVHVKPLKLGTQDGLVVQVTDGLQGGERVVIDGADRLREGAKVVVPDPNAPAAKVGTDPTLSKAKAAKPAAAP